MPRIPPPSQVEGFCRSPHPKPLSLSGREASDSIRERNLRRLPLLPVREKGAGGMREQAHWDAIPEKPYT
jgi:hypothetical protein